MKKEKLYEKKCARCGKLFCISSSLGNWAYKRKQEPVKYYCSWTCMIHATDECEADVAETTKRIVNGST